MKKYYLALGLILVAMTALAVTMVDISWSPVTTRVDGTPLATAQLGGYRVYDETGVAPAALDTYNASTSCPNPAPPGTKISEIAASSTTVSITAAASHTYVLTAFDTNGCESKFSTMLATPSARPNFPTINSKWRTQ